MLLISPIPRCYLPHKVRLIEKLSSDGWGGKGETLETDINFVCIEPCRSQRFSLGGDIPEVRAKMYFDAFSSVPNDVSFETGDEVIFNGETFVVSEVETFFTPQGDIHHLEVVMT
jgi:hypothetical protein